MSPSDEETPDARLPASNWGRIALSAGIVVLHTTWQLLAAVWASMSGWGTRPVGSGGGFALGSELMTAGHITTAAVLLALVVVQQRSPEVRSLARFFRACVGFAWLLFVFLLAEAVVSGPFRSYVAIDPHGQAASMPEVGLRPLFVFGAHLFAFCGAWGLSLVVRSTRRWQRHLLWMVPIGLYAALLALWPQPPPFAG